MSMIMCETCDGHFDTDFVDGIFVEHKDGVDWYCSVECFGNDVYENWDIEVPPRQSKSAKPKMGISGRSLKNLIGPLIDKKRRKK